MKKKILITAVLVLAVSLNVLANETEKEQISLAVSPDYYRDCFDPMLEPDEVRACLMENYCMTLWLMQPILEPLIIPYIQARIGNDKSCEWYYFGMLIDWTFWLPLACICNQDTVGCSTWTYDFLYNLISSYSYCR